MTATVPVRIAEYIAVKARTPGHAPLLHQLREAVMESSRYIAGRTALQLRGPSGRWMDADRALDAWARVTA
jgi:hypothetical protein